jgi:lipopolysaccharide biosynthesis glycosyltransferase
LNTGVLLMRLSEIRRANITGYDIVYNNSEKVLLGDQDFFNSWSYFHQDIVGVLPCKWNKRIDSQCPTHETAWEHLVREGHGIVHGTRHALSKGKLRHISQPYEDRFNTCRSIPASYQ